MRDEARAGSARQIKALFKSGLAEYLGLNTEQSTRLQELLTRKSDVVWQDFLMPLFTNDLDENAMRDAGHGGPLYVCDRRPAAPHAPSDRGSHGDMLAAREVLRRNENAAGQN